MGPMGFGPPGRGNFEYKKIDKPKSVTDVPRYLRELLGGFFSRLFYIFKLVWQTGPWILFLMSFIALFEGLAPVVGSLISKNILNELQDAYTAYTGNGVYSGVVEPGAASECAQHKRCEERERDIFLYIV